MEHEELNEDREQQPPVDESVNSEETTNTEDTGDTTASSSAAILAHLQARFGLNNAILTQDATLTEARDALNHADWQTRTAAVHRIGAIGGQEDVALLIARLQSDEVAAVRAAAGRALSVIHATIQEKPLLDTFAQDDDDDVREMVVTALGSRGKFLSSQAIQTLEDAFYEEQNEDIRAAIITALGNCGEQTPMEVISIAFYDPSWLVREAAVITMGKQQERADLNALEEMLNDEIQPVSDAAAYALNRIVTETRLPGDISPEKNDDDTPSDGGASETPPTIMPNIEMPPSTDTTDTSSAKSPMIGTDRDVSFLKLEPTDIEGFYPVITQAFDDQWVPSALLRAIFNGKTTYQAIEPYLAYLVRTEYMRSLITSDKLIINRVFIYNNPSLYRDILPGRSGREAFKHFLDQGVIVPFLFNETSPIDIPSWINTNSEGFSAWEKICQEVQAQCLRFSWNNEENQSEAIDQLALKFHQFAVTAEALKMGKLARELGVDITQQQALRKQFERVADESRQYYRDTDRHIVRTYLYEQFVTEGRPALRHYDGAKPFAGAIKQYLDLAYNSNLADSLGGNLLTPADSPTRHILQEWDSLMKNTQDITAENLIAMLRREAFQHIQTHLEQYYLKSMGLLSLNDVQELRKTDEWFQYIAALHQLLKAPALFSQLADEVSSKYVTLIQRITTLIGERNRQMGGTLMAPWQPGVEVTVQVGGEKLLLHWSANAVSSNAPTERDEVAQMVSQVQTRGRGDALCDIRLTITDGRPSSERANLSSSFEVLKGRMPRAREQFEEVLRKFGEAFKRREFSGDDTRSSTLNMPKQTV